MISLIIFSKDRALQLDLLLKSIKINLDVVKDVRVIYTVSNERHEESYNKLKFEHRSWITFTKQEQGHKHLFYYIYEACCLATSKFICFFTDDNIVYEKVEEKDMGDALSLFDDSAFSCFSLRMGFNICERQIEGNVYHLFPYHATFLQPESNESIIIWDRTTVPFGDYWSYCLSVDGHIFRKDDMVSMTNLMHIWTQIETLRSSPNEFESKLQRFNYEYGPFMGAFTHSKVVNSPNNRVQHDVKNRSGDVYKYSADYCNELFLEGHRIDFNTIVFPEIKSPHTELKLL